MRKTITLEELRSYRDPANIGRPPFEVHRMRQTRTGWVVETEEHWFGQYGVEWQCTPSYKRRYFKAFADAAVELARRDGQDEGRSD